MLVATLVLPALAIIFALSWESYREHRRAVLDELLNTARAVASLADAEVVRSRSTLEAFAATRSFREEDWATLDAIGRRVLESEKRWLVVLEMTGEPVVNTRLPLGSAIPKLDLRPDYVEAMKAGRVYVSDLVFGPASQSLVVHVGLPFQHPNGRLYGLSIVMQPETIGESLNVGRFAPEGVLALLDRAGRIIVRNPGQETYMGRSATPDVVKAITAGEEGVGESVTLEKIPVLIAFARARCGWAVALGTPKAKMLASAQHLLLLGVGSAVLVTAFAVILALWIGRSLIRSVDALTRDAERLGRGELPEPLTTELEETDFIGQAMQRMAETLARELQAKSAAESDLRSAQAELRRYAEELEKKVEERTASLREAITQMEEFSYTVSHDLRSPLRALSGYASVLLEDYGPQLDDTGRDYLSRIQRASLRMDQLTTDVLNYSRVARGDVQTRPVKVETLVRHVIEQYRELHDDVADIRLVTPMEPVLAHEPSLTQALANLLTNAAKFVRPGQRPDITVRTEKGQEGIRIWVEDRGIGIPKQHQDRLFRMFERAPSSNGYTGTGVGLAIVRKAVEKMGGTCGVESDGATGSRFWIELRAA